MQFPPRNYIDFAILGAQLLFYIVESSPYAGIIPANDDYD
jgi:hypothetical protein